MTPSETSPEVKSLKRIGQRPGPPRYLPVGGAQLTDHSWERVGSKVV
jgi:hypothetical protein